MVSSTSRAVCAVQHQATNAPRRQGGDKRKPATSRNRSKVPGSQVGRALPKRGVRHEGNNRLHRRLALCGTGPVRRWLHVRIYSCLGQSRVHTPQQHPFGLLIGRIVPCHGVASCLICSPPPLPLLHPSAQRQPGIFADISTVCARGPGDSSFPSFLFPFVTYVDLNILHSLIAAALAEPPGRCSPPQGIIPRQTAKNPVSSAQRVPARKPHKPSRSILRAGKIPGSSLLFAKSPPRPPPHCPLPTTFVIAHM
ncbi:hypothetical protein LLEC1_04922 [Akanthomyces lecanii]|uniref:Uncharacterized protein n=1 Tax=Cordyceps confragosa TaxID=2714763 RepID=A0A179I1W5_CORDF|nr:hypothetical protein LLEC1_04922 [Akanthomyces lecanii]